MLEHVNFDEAKQSQLPAIELLVNMGYEYISAEEVLRQRRDDPSNFLLTDIAAAKFMEINSYEVGGKQYKFSEKEVRDAIDELEHIPYEGLVDTSQKIYNMIMPTSGGKTIKVNVGGKNDSKNFRFIDFEHPENNVFHVTAEYPATGKGNIRPDIVCFVNGIPIVVIENKKSSVETEEAIKQMCRNQTVEYCPQLFTYTQLLIATNGKSLEYGTTSTPRKFYAIWKEKGTSLEDQNDKVNQLISKPISKDIYAQILTDLNGYTKGYAQKLKRLPTEQDRGLLSLCEPARLLDLVKNYILYDAGTKKLSRYQQYFAIHLMLKRISQEEMTKMGKRRLGGLIWHTQGSGKSLTMVMFVKALIESPAISNPRVIIVTDRKDLDRQIRDTFRNCNLKKKVTQATSGQHLINLIHSKSLDVITTVIDKFDSAAGKKVGFTDPDQNIFILVDEAHRSQYGDTAAQMTRILPNACLIGFTGTPVLKKDKTRNKFGSYIDKYTIDDALEDKIILPLIYEGRYVDLVQNETQVDRRVEQVSEDLSRRYNAGVSEDYLKQLQSQITADIIKNNPQRIEEVARNIEDHYSKTFKGTGLKGQIVAPSKFSAILFQKYFEVRNLVRSAVVISDEHDDGDQLDTHKLQVVRYLDTIRANHQSVATYEKSVIDSFKNNEDGIELLIVVDKLLTGFDAPRNTVLYLAKDLKDHNLLQAIARVNRLFDNKKLPKTSGYIIDYSENAKNIDTAMKLFGNYDEGDVKGTLVDVKEKIAELESSYSLLHDIFKEIKGSSDDEEFLQFLDDEPRRTIFYESLNLFIRNLNECYVLQDFVNEFQNLDMYTRDLKKFMELRRTASLKYADKVDLSEYRQSLVNILDKYIDASGVELLTKQIVITDRARFKEAIDTLGTDKSKAEAIAAQTEKTIQQKMDSDPEFYERFSKKITEILQAMKEGKLADIAALKQLRLIEDDVVNKKDDSVPSLIAKEPGSDVFYRNLRDNFGDLNDQVYISIILDIFKIIKQEAIVDWHKNVDVKRRIKNVIDDYLYDKVKVEKGIGIDEVNIQKIIDNVLILSENNYEIFS